MMPSTLPRHYNDLLVVFSFLVALLASYTALDLTGRIKVASKRAAPWWLLSGALAMGLGVWSMHFIGMLAFSLPIELGYDWTLTIASLAIAIASSALALWISGRNNLPTTRLVIGAVLMGIGIAAMHYTGMAAMQMSPGIIYTTSWVALSVIIAIVAAGGAMWIAFHLRRYNDRLRYIRIGSASLMAVGIVAMHYTGMAAAQFPIGSICGGAAHGLKANGLAVPVIVGTVAVLGVTLMTSIMDLRLQLKTAVLASSLVQANKELLHLSLHDNLTKLPNRSLLQERLIQAIEHATQTQTMFAVMFLDLDGFKDVNDTFGHQTGDSLLIDVAERLRQALRLQDTIARVGGDEFVLVANVGEAAHAGYLADKLVRAIDEPFLIAGHDLCVSASIGIAIYPQHGTDPDDLLKHADAAMYHAKSDGRNRVHFFESMQGKPGTEPVGLLQDLRMARSRGEFLLLYQPMFHAADGALMGAEALLRWNHPRRGMIEPDDFIPLAERSGLIVSIGDWVIEEACRQLAQWRQAGRPHLTMAINISPLQFTHAGFVALVAATLDRHALEAESLVLEVTESTAMRDVETSLMVLEQLRALGVRISIDDFGTGYSSLLYLRRLPASELKIDRGFIAQLAGDTNDAAIVSAIVALGATLNLNIVAEGVETDAQRDLLTQLGCNVLQGFLLGRPMSAADFDQPLRVGSTPAEMILTAAVVMPSSE
jgi:diguanylate cyclase (GGDEF)-like protein